MKCVCFRCKRICFSHVNVGVIFSHLTTHQFRSQNKVTISALFCILKAVIFMLGLRRKRYSSVRRLLRCLLRKYREQHTYRHTDLRRAGRKTAFTIDWLVGWLAEQQMRSNVFHFDIACGWYCSNIKYFTAISIVHFPVYSEFRLIHPHKKGCHKVV